MLDSVSRRWLVPAVPFGLSLCLSLATVGTHPFWQDSGVYLTAIKELGVLYPPGFVLYEVLSFCWTKLLFFLDFTLAVHLFSAVCAALAAGTTALAARDLLRSRGKIFRVTAEDPGPAADGPAILAGVLLAGGFTFWSTAIYAKVYTFYYLVLALLLWRMIRADDSGRPRDFTIVAGLIGLSWQAHPSAALIGVALVLFVAAHARSLGAKGVGLRILVAAGCALGPSVLLLPILIAREPWLVFGTPRGILEFARYVLGIRFVGAGGAFGYDPTRGVSFFRFLWEDTLGVGLLLMLLGLIEIGRRSRPVVVGLVAWIVPYALMTILFRNETQHDCWFVAARLPLHLALAVGAYQAALRAAEKARLVLAAAGAVGTAWAVGVNFADVSLRNYRLAEHYGRILIENVDPKAIVILAGDDSNGLAAYMHRVRGERPDVILVTSSFLHSRAASENDWYEGVLVARHPTLVRPDYTGLRERFPGVDMKQLATAALINANAGGDHPIFCEFAIPPDLIRPGYGLVPAGVHWKLVPRDELSKIEERYWKFPIEPEQVRPLYRRARAQDHKTTADGISVKPQHYERRLAAMILKSRFRLALAMTDQGRFAQAAKLCQSIIDYDDEEFETNPEIIHLLGISYYAAGVHDKAEPALRASVDVATRRETRATALFYLGDIARKRGDGAQAQRYFDQALSIPGLDPAFIRKMEARRKSP